jgi:predicted lipoprotein with Yx(FWY)xxD motif
MAPSAAPYSFDVGTSESARARPVRRFPTEELPVRIRTPIALAAAAALVLAACETDDTDTDLGTTDDDATVEESDDTEDQPDDAQEEAGEDGEAADAPADELDSDQWMTTGLNVASSDLGDHLVDADDRTVYASAVRGEDDPCIGDCAQVRPPVLIDGEAELGEGVDEGLVGTLELDDGTTQLTYDGQPLHFYFLEEPGEAQGHNLANEWFVVSPSGELIDAPDDAGTDDDADDADDDAATDEDDEDDEDDGEDG